MDKKCPFCPAKLQPWRFDFAEKFKNDPEAIEAAKTNNPDLDLPHALYHIPESF